MPCTPDYCDMHDYDVAPGSGWCRAVDTAYLRSLDTPRSSSHDEDLAGAILRLGDILERMDRRLQPKTSFPSAPQQRKERKGGTPL
mgnify:CR=1 FL=1